MKTKYKFPKPAEEFLSFVDVNRQPATLYSYSTALKQFHVFISEKKIKLKHVNRVHIEKFMQLQKNQGKSSATRSVRLIELRGYFFWLHEMSYISENPNILIKSTDYPKVPTRLPRPLPPEVDRILLERLRKVNCHYCKGLLIQRLTGLRVSELSKLEFNCIHKNASGEAFLKVPVGKLHNERLVPITKEIEKVIALCQKQTKIKTMHGQPLYLIAGPRTDFVCLNTFRRALFNITSDIKQLDSEKFSPHRLRHTYATELINAGMNLITVMKLLGHRSPNMTLTYAKVSGETIQREYLEALENITKNHKVLKKTTNRFKEFDPSKALLEVKTWLSKNQLENSKTSKKKLSHLTDRVRRLQIEIERLKKEV